MTRLSSTLIRKFKRPPLIRGFLYRGSIPQEQRVTEKRPQNSVARHPQGGTDSKFSSILLFLHKHAHLLLWLLGGALAIGLLVPQASELRRAVSDLGSAEWGWLASGVLASALTYVMAAIAQAGAVERSLALGPLTLVQVASDFLNTITPEGLGGMGLNERYLVRQGVGQTTAVGAVGLNMAAGAVIHGLGLVLVAILIGRSHILDQIRIPVSWPEIIVGAAVLVLIVVVIEATPLGRRRVISPIARALQSMLTVLRKPGRAIELFGGSAGLTCAYMATLGMSLYAFGADVSVAKILTVYLVGIALGSAVPTPGGLGGVEAVLVGGFIAVGVEAVPAIAAVYTFRLLTFWIPIIPGFFAFHYLQNRKLI